MKIRFGFLFSALLGLTIMMSCQSETANDNAKQAASEAVKAAATTAQAAGDAVQNAVPTGPSTSIDFKSGLEYDFGTIDEGEVVSHVFEFKNTGSEPLLLTDAKGSCGCTVPDWPKTPIAPGETGEIEVKFNSQGKGGARNQKVTLTANTNPQQTFLYLKGNVTPAANKETSK